MMRYIEKNNKRYINVFLKIRVVFDENIHYCFVIHQNKMKNHMTINTKRTYSTQRDDGQRCHVHCDERIDEETGEIKSKMEQKSAKFFAFNKENYKQHKVKLAMKNPLANALLEFFVSEMDNTNAICVSMKTLEVLFNLKRNALSKHINYLVDNDFIQIFKHGNMNVYAVNAYLVWTQGDANLWKAKFTATMYLNYDEQTTKVKQEYSKKIKIK